jgi:hypothetical protein
MPEALPKPEALPNPQMEAAFAQAKPLVKPVTQSKLSLPPTVKSGVTKSPVTKETSPGQTVASGETKEPKPEASTNVPPQPPNHSGKSYNKKFLAICGATLLEDDRVLLPRQVIPFSAPWQFLAPAVRFVRWQIALQLEETRDDAGVRMELHPIWEQNSLLADRLSYRVITRPDGSAGFTGRKMVVESPMHRADVDSLLPAIDPEGWRYHPGALKENPAELMARILPKFYITLSDKEVTRLKEEAEAGNPTLLRKVYDITVDEWKWMSELRFPYEARPVVISDRPAMDWLEARAMHDAFGGSLLNSKVYIGGNGLVSEGTILDPDVPEPTADDQTQIQSLHLKVATLLKRHDPKLESIMVPLPNNSHESSRKSPKDFRNKHRDPGERHDSIREYLDRVINGAERVVMRRIYKDSAIV